MKPARTKRPAKGSPPSPAVATLPHKKKPAAGRVEAGAPDSVSQSREAFADFSRIVAAYIASLDPSSPAEAERLRREMQNHHWPDNPATLAKLIQFADGFLRAYMEKAGEHEGVAFQYVSLLSDACQYLHARSSRVHLSAIAPRLYRWPVAINARPEYASERKEKLAMIRRLNVAGAVPERVFRPLRGGLGPKVDFYLSLLVQESLFPGGLTVRSLPPLSAETLNEYESEAWKLFLREYGEKYEADSFFDGVAPRKIQGASVSEGKRRDIIRDAWEGAFKTRAKQLSRLSPPAR